MPQRAFGSVPRRGSMGAFRWLLLGIWLTSCGGTGTEHRAQNTAIRKEYTAGLLYQRGEASAALGDLTRAEQYFVAALKSGGNEKRIVQRLLVVCVTDERYPVALEYAEDYLHRHPNDPDIQFAAASIHVALGNAPRARMLLESVVQSRPQWSEAHYVLATVLRDQGESPDRADVHDLEYLRLDPEGPLAERARARLRHAQP